VTACTPFPAGGPAGIADALQKLDCAATEATTLSFGRLFGHQGAFQSALTILLTIYVAVFAMTLLTGRSPLRVSVLTPRMLTLGIALTFVTSWVAYQSVVLNLAVGAPDQIATVLIGGHGSATLSFAQRLDALFDSLFSAVQSAQAVSPTGASLSSPTNVLSVAALILLIGTVGVLAVCRLALAALLILGPLFIVLALFEGTRGLFEGWLKSVVLFALVPLMTVLLGSGALYAITPRGEGMGAGGDVTLRTAVSILVASIVYAALMVTTFKVAASLTRSWRARARTTAEPITPHARAPEQFATSIQPLLSSSSAGSPSERVRSTVATLEMANYSSLGRHTSAEISLRPRAETFMHPTAIDTRRDFSPRVELRSRGALAKPHLPWESRR
jgi:type IV secretion system protein VirB6